MKVAKLTKAGEARVLDGREGMTFVIDSFGGVNDRCANVRDYRFPSGSRPFQIWTLVPACFEMVEE